MTSLRESVDSSEGSQRRERAAIAAQACQTCRNRKSKCDEQRPKCGLCRRLNVTCQYREPMPTKKDKTMVHILDALTRLETKFDNLAVGQSSVSSTPDMTTKSSATYPSSRSSGRPAARSDAFTARRARSPSLTQYSLCLVVHYHRNQRPGLS